MSPTWSSAHSCTRIQSRQRAREQHNGKLLALKVFRASVTANGAALFRAEIDVITRLNHPHIIPVLESDRTDGRLWYTMPYADEESLHEQLLTKTSWEDAEVLRVLADVAAALAYSHTQGVIHGDIKPGNILLSGGRARLADFGIARAHMLAVNAHQAGPRRHDKTVMLAIPGRSASTSPEQASGQESVDHRADLYSLGVVAYRLLAGQMPFADATRWAFLRAQLTSRPVRVSVHRPLVHPLLEQLVMQLLESRVNDRPVSASHVRAVLDAVATATATQSLDQSAPRATQESSRR